MFAAMGIVGLLALSLVWIGRQYVSRNIAESRVALASVNELGMEFVRFNVGSFIMGSEEESVPVSFTRPFEMMTTEVTQRQWFEVMRENPSKFHRDFHCVNHRIIDEVEMCPEHPVEQVSWEDVQEFIKALNEMEGRIDCDGTPESGAGCYRLPTEAEWEYAARAGTQTLYPHGNSSEGLEYYGWYRKNAGGQTRRVRTREANVKGLHDTQGNVGEWTQDVFKKVLPGGVNPVERGTTAYRSFRGGSWSFSALNASLVARSYGGQRGQLSFVGFRLARSL